MKVNVTINSLCNHQVLKANAQLTFDNCFVVKGVKVCSGSKGLYVKMPSEKMPGNDEHGNPQYKDTAFPITPGARDAINKAVLAQYELALEKAKPIEITALEQPQQTEPEEVEEVEL